MMTQAEEEGEDVVTIIEVTILLSQEVIETHPTAVKNAGAIDPPEIRKISVRCQMQLLITGMIVAPGETEEVVQKTDHNTITIDTGNVKVMLEVMVLHQDIDTVKESVMTLTLRWYQHWM